MKNRDLARGIFDAIEEQLTLSDLVGALRDRLGDSDVCLTFKFLDNDLVSVQVRGEEIAFQELRPGDVRRFHAACHRALAIEAEGFAAKVP